MSEGKRTRARAKYCQFQNTISFDLRRNLTCRLKLWDDIAEILPYMNFQVNRNWGKVAEPCKKRPSCFYAL